VEVGLLQPGEEDELVDDDDRAEEGEDEPAQHRHHPEGLALGLSGTIGDEDGSELDPPEAEAAEHDERDVVVHDYLASTKLMLNSDGGMLTVSLMSPRCDCSFSSWARKS